MEPNDTQFITPGLIIIQGNHSEDLRALLIEWIKRYPLAALENEIILAQSNGISQWLKLALAADATEEIGSGCGIAAAVEISLPARFLWRTYRAILGRKAVPEISPFDQARLIWRLMRLLPELINQEIFFPIRRFLDNDPDCQKRLQLAHQIADLFDQYQVYRADWLIAWAQGDDILIQAHGERIPLPEEQLWQATLWRSIISDIAATNLDNIATAGRAQVHAQFLERSANLPGPNRPRGIPRRIIIFGISTLPRQSIEALINLARWTQVLIFIHNPCEYYWGDIIRTEENLLQDTEQLFDHGHPLLKLWGKQGRELLSLLEENPFAHRIEIFTQLGENTLLQQLQDDIRALRPLSETRTRWPAYNPQQDFSIRFHIAHSRQREIEILHDQLLAAFNSDPSLRPREIIVMAPIIDHYAPYIEAVFNSEHSDDPRFIPFSIVDRRRRNFNRLINAIEKLIKLPESYISLSTILELLDIPALQRKFGISSSDRELLSHWLNGANIRWGLHPEHREYLGLTGELQNTWIFGLRRILFGYAVGANPDPWNEILAYPEISGLDAEILGPFIQFLDLLETTWRELRTPATINIWCNRFRALINNFFQIENTAEDYFIFAKLENALQQLQEDALDAQLIEELPGAIISNYWFAQIDHRELAQRFFTGTITFANLMPMRAIPFRHIYLLGMNDSDYPRAYIALDFDLMAHNYRVGDRSRNEDDHYLFLEALLSARERLYISWVGRGITDHAVYPPSILVTQLRDHLANGWHLIDQDRLLLNEITIEHPPQPFSAAYFNSVDERLFSYMHEWCPIIAKRPDKINSLQDEKPLPICDIAPLTVTDLASFLKAPVKYFFHKRLQVYLDKDDPGNTDQEILALDKLQEWKLKNKLIQKQVHILNQGRNLQIDFASEFAGLKLSGELPWGGIGENYAEEILKSDIISRYSEQIENWPKVITDREKIWFSAEINGQMLILSDWVQNIRCNNHGTRAQFFFEPNKLYDGKKIKHYHKLIQHWVWHLAAHLIAPITTVIIAQDNNVILRPWEITQVRNYLLLLLEKLQSGMRYPLPLAQKTAFAWLKKKNSENARNIYEDSDNYFELEHDLYLQRTYPNFDALTASQEFYILADAIFKPLIDSCVSIYGK